MPASSNANALGPVRAMIHVHDPPDLPRESNGRFRTHPPPQQKGRMENVLSTNYGGARAGMLEPDCHRDHGLDTLRQNSYRTPILLVVYIAPNGERDAQTPTQKVLSVWYNVDRVGLAVVQYYADSPSTKFFF